METLFQRLLAPLLLLALPAAVQAQFTYTTNNGAITITGYIGSDSVVTIPTTITGLPGTGIGNRAFGYCTNLTSVTIPNSITSLEQGAFYFCTSPTNVTIGAGFTSIGQDVFCYCWSLTSVTIPASVTSIGEHAFSFCTRLTSVMIPSSVTNIVW